MNGYGSSRLPLVTRWIALLFATIAVAAIGPTTVNASCCFLDGSCADISQSECVAGEGVFFAGVTCAFHPCPEIGACCLPDGSCLLTAEVGCANRGGEWQGPGVPCTPLPCPRACCFPDGSCADLSEAECAAAGGEFDAGNSCATVDCPQPLGACCFPDGSCEDLSAEDCAAAGGEFNAGTSCAFHPCPQPGGTCLLIIDEDSIDNGALAIEELANEGVCGGGIPAVCVNDQLADPGVRDPLPIPVGTIIGNGVPGGTSAPLMTGQLFDEGWFRLEVAPASWSAAGPTPDGLLNYLLAEADGFGRDGEFLLDQIPDVTPLRTADLQALVGEVCCAVVYDSDVSINYNPLLGNLQGANLGILHLRVLAVGEPDDEVLPDITIEVLDPDDCFEAPTDPPDIEDPTPVGGNESVGLAGYRLDPSLPNPTKSFTSIRYALPAPGSVHLAIYEATGRLVRVLVSMQVQAAGEYAASWDGRDDQGRMVASGAYVYRLQAGEYRASRPLHLVR